MFLVGQWLRLNYKCYIFLVVGLLFCIFFLYVLRLILCDYRILWCWLFESLLLFWFHRLYSLVLFLRNECCFYRQYLLWLWRLFLVFRWFLVLSLDSFQMFCECLSDLLWCLLEWSCQIKGLHICCEKELLMIFLLQGFLFVFGFKIERILKLLLFLV